MNHEMKMLELRHEVISCSDYSIEGVLSALDLHGHQWVTGDDLFTYLKNYGFDVEMRQIEKLVESINCSLDGKINLDQLRWVV